MFFSCVPRKNSETESWVLLGLAALSEVMSGSYRRTVRAKRSAGELPLV